MSSIWEDMTGIKSHTVDEVKEVVDKAVAAAQPERGEILTQLENTALPGEPSKGQPGGPDLASGVASMDVPGTNGPGTQPVIGQPEIGTPSEEKQDDGPEIDM